MQIILQDKLLMIIEHYFNFNNQSTATISFLSIKIDLGPFLV